jgi:hypothetical protein
MIYRLQKRGRKKKKKTMKFGVLTKEKEFTCTKNENKRIMVMKERKMLKVIMLCLTPLTTAD